MGSNPLVSVLIYNYNYGKYLKECVESVLNQTYKNIEIIFSDNASEDNSWEIINELVKKHPNKITITRNRQNFGAEANFRNCFMNIRGKYYVPLCSDDSMEPTFIEKCVNVLEKYKNVTYVVVNRNILQNEKKIKEKPFYKYSCIIPGKEQSLVYMMAAVNPSISQVMYRMDVKEIFTNGAVNTVVGKWYATRLLDFKLCLAGDMAYIAKPLLNHRIHQNNQNLEVADNLLEVIGFYVLEYYYVEEIKNYGIDDGRYKEKLKQALYKLATLSLRYSSRALLAENEILAKKYFNLSYVMDEKIIDDPIYQQLQNYFIAKDKKILNFLKKQKFIITRKVSYDPPEGSKRIRIL
jgi:glycosyltransferase involved in cell wall biosynthesis